MPDTHLLAERVAVSFLLVLLPGQGSNDRKVFRPMMGNQRP